ncbi:heme A synthase [Paracoccus sp. p4-l81]|uniref:heme A synthase n=1 Tax=unclassified Paracoccus (in: a-proteobacteria) TaxID=2688777 RepID=UPI0035B8902F
MSLKPKSGSAPRAIFQEVGDSPRPLAQTGMIDARPKGARGAIRAWLIVLFVLVVAMIAVGGATRLTDSGLSITEWRPVTGAVPPLSDADWQAEFARYQASPQFQNLNPNMDLAGFKSIYWWEWGHRQLGRVVGLVWAVGFVFFWATRRIPPGWTPRLLGLGLLGGAQGAIGWWMVASGLTNSDAVAVASTRLAVHLGLAFVILGLIAWYVLHLARPEAALIQARRAGERRLFGAATGLMHLAFVQIILGALVAGIDAGRGYTDWPWMGGRLIPADMWSESPVWRNLIDNPATVQFIHRIAGYLLLAGAVAVWWRARSSSHPLTRAAFGLAALMAGVQAALGIVTVLHGAPLALGLAHQLGAVALWVLILRARHRAAYPVVQSIRGA